MARAGAEAQVALTLWANFIHSGDPNRPFDSRSLFRRRSSGQSSPTMSPSSPSSFPSKSRAWGRYDRRRQRYLKLDLNPEMRSHYRLHAMSVWRHLIPRLHLAGANNIFPQHNAFVGHDDPSLFSGVVRQSSFSHGYQVNRKFFDAASASAMATSPPPPSGTTCFPVNSRGQIMTEYLSSSSSAGGATNPHEIGGGGDPSSIVRWEKANQHAYQHAMFLTIGVGALLLAVNVWFLLCLFFCRNRLSCCLMQDGGSGNGATGQGGRMGAKEYSCQTELVGIADREDSVHTFREIHPTVSSQTLSRRSAQQGGPQTPSSRTGSLGRGGEHRHHHHQHSHHELDAATAAQESLRLLQPSDSDRESHSTSTASQEGGRTGGGRHQHHHSHHHHHQQQGQKTPTEAPKGHHHSHHQHHPRCQQSSEGGTRQRKDSTGSTSSSHNRKSSLSSTSMARSSSGHHHHHHLVSPAAATDTVLHHTLDSSCRLRAGEATTAAPIQLPVPSPAEVAGLRMAASPNGSSSTASSQGISIIIPPPKEHQYHPHSHPAPPPPLISSLKRPPQPMSAAASTSSGSGSDSGGGTGGKAMTTFGSSPLERLEQLNQKLEEAGNGGGGGSGNATVVSFGGETILQ